MGREYQYLDREKRRYGQWDRMTIFWLDLGQHAHSMSSRPIWSQIYSMTMYSDMSLKRSNIIM